MRQRYGADDEGKMIAILRNKEHKAKSSLQQLNW